MVKNNECGEERTDSLWKLYIWKEKKQISDLATKSSSSSCRDRLTETKHIILSETSEEEHTVLDNSFQDIGY